MSVLILPVTQSNPNQRFSSGNLPGPNGNATYIFDVRWNIRDLAWFLDVYDNSEIPVKTGIKIVLGTFLGRASTHVLFRSGVFQAIDTTGKNVEAGLDDLGARVQLVYIPETDLLAFLGTP